MRVLAWPAVLLLAASLLAACGGGGNGGSSERGVASCSGIKDLVSYRYNIAIKLQSPAFQQTEGATPAPPLTAFAAQLTALLSDFSIDGSHVAPDRTQAILKFQQDRINIRAIGDKRWVWVGGVFQEQPASEQATLLTPEVVCSDIVVQISEALDDIDSDDEAVNGIEAKRYSLSQADLQSLPSLLGANGAADLPESFQVDIWLAKDGHWPVRLIVESRDAEQGQAIGSLSVSMEIRDINDPGINIEPPPSPAGG